MGEGMRAARFGMPTNFNASEAIDLGVARDGGAYVRS
jgi:hypothetical protein